MVIWSASSRRWFALAGVLVLSALVGCSDDDLVVSPLPTVIESLTPETGPSSGGTLVRVRGDYFPQNAEVFFGKNKAERVEFVSSSELIAVVPIATAEGAVGVQVRDPNPDIEGQVGVIQAEFTYFDPSTAEDSRPTDVEIKTSRGPTAGGTITLVTGEDIGEGAVVFFGFSQGKVIEQDEGAVVVQTPLYEAEESVAVTLQNPDGQFTVISDGFSFYELEEEPSLPVLGGVDPPQGSLEGGTAVALSGENLPAASDLPLVLFGTRAITGLVDGTGGALGAPTPAHALGSVAVTVTTTDGLSARLEPGFTYADGASTSEERLRILAVIPDQVELAGGEELTVIGLGFVEGATLNIAGQDLETTFVDVNTLNVVAPAVEEPGEVDVVVTLPDGASYNFKSGFTYFDGGLVDDPDELRLLALVPAEGDIAGGEAVELRGTDFVEGMTVAFGLLQVEAQLIDENTLRVTAPASEQAGSVDVTVTHPDTRTDTLAGGYTYVEPAVEVEALRLLAVLPGGGPIEGDTQVTLRGVGFDESAVVLFGEDALETQFVDEFTLVVTAPGVDSPRQMDVSVRLGDERVSTLEDAYTYFEPVDGEERLLLLAAIPDRGPLAGGTEVTLRGLGFVPGAEVSFGLQEAETVFIDGNTLQVTAPVGQEPGLADMTVRLPDARTNTLRGAFTYVDTDVVPVEIDLLNPAFGPVGAPTLTLITGSGFDPATEVLFGQALAADVEFLDANTLAVVTPASDTIELVDVQITNSSQSTAILEEGFAFVDPDVIDSPPAISRITPGRGPSAGGTQIQLRGLGFERGARVRFGGILATEVQVLSGALITAVTPPSLRNGPVTVSVINPNGMSAHVNPGFLYYVVDELTPSPVIAAIQPETGLNTGGTPVVLDGQNLTGTSQVFVAGRPALELVVVDDERLTFQTPPSETPGRASITLTRTDGLSATLEDAFTYRLPAPSILSVSPSRGPQQGGTIARLEGDFFTEGVEVFFGGRAAEVLEVVNSGTLTIQTPPGPVGAVDVTVQNPDGQSDTLAQGFTYGGNVGEDPTIASVSPDRGPVAGGTRLLIEGTNFDDGLAVRFGDIPALNVTVVSAQLATAVTPPGQEGAVDVVVTGGNGGVATAADAFTYLAVEDFEDPAPELAGISPTRGAIFGGTRVSVAGANMRSGVLVFVGGAPVLDTQRSSNSLLTATTPPGAEGLADVDVTNTDGQSATLPRAFEYLEGIGGNDDPEILTLEPARGPSTGGTRALMEGRNFRPDVQILIAGRSATDVQLIDAETLTFRVPAGENGPAAVTVINTDGRTDTRSDGFLYLDPDVLGPGPELSGVLPSSGSATGGDEVLLTGARFDDASRVFFGGRPAVVNAVLGQTLLRVLTPQAAPGVVDVEVVDGDGQTSRLERAFTYTNDSDQPPPSLTRLVPARGAAQGGTVVSIIGNGLTPQTEIFIANRLAESTFIAETHVQIVTPAGVVGAADVTAVNNDGQTATLRDGYTYLEVPEGELPPQVLGVTPNSGREGGGEDIVISGRRFAATPAVLVGGRPATDVRFISDGLLRATTPPGQPGPRDVVVTNPNGLSDIFEDAFTYVAAPSILDITPVVGPTTGDTVVSISGQNFQNGAVVFFGDQAASSASVLGPSVIEATTPAAAAAVVDVVVINPDTQRSVAAGAFTFVPAPTVDAVRPNRGPAFGGTFVVVQGDDFRPGARVFFGDEESQDVAFVDEGTLTVQLPVSGPGVVSVRVVNPGGQGDELVDAFTYLSVQELGAPPELTRVVPGQGPSSGGTIALAEGVNFDSELILLLGRAPASRVFVYGADRASFISPPSAQGQLGTVAVYAINSDGQMATLVDGFRYTDPDELGAPPQVSRIEPDEGSSRGDEAVALNGTGFAPGALVLIGGRSGSLVQVPTANLIQLRTPEGDAGAADVVVTNLDGQSGVLRSGYLYVPPPELDAVTPARGPATTTTRVTLTGNHFVEGATVTIGGQDAQDIVVRDAGTILATFPVADDPREGGEDIVVTNPDGQSATLAQAFFYIPPPELASLDPAEGPAEGAAEVQVYGANFQPGAIVRVGDERALNVQFVTDRHLTISTPPGVAGVAGITVVNPDGQSDVLPGAYTYIAAPRVDEISPTSGSLEGGTTMDISGNFFQPGAQVLIGNNAAGDITFISAQVIRVTIPPGAAGPAGITVVNPDGQSNVLPGAYTYIPPRPSPSIVGITPNFGDEIGGTNVTILGNFFQFGAKVFFGDAEAVNVEVLSATYIRARTPGNNPGLVDVTVQNPDDEFVILEDGFNYVARGQLPPVAVTQIVPNTGSINGNTRVQVVGAGFRIGAQVSFDGVPCTDIRYVGPTVITCTTGAHPAGDVNVSVTNPNAESATLELGYTYGNSLALELSGFRLPPESIDKRGALSMDVDNDQDTDFFVFDDAQGNAYMYINDGEGTFLQRELGPFATNCTSPSFCRTVAAAKGDIDNDGDLDILVGFSDRQLGLYLNQGDGNFERHYICPNNNCNDARWRNPGALALLDIDADGDLDVIVADNDGPNSIALSEGPGVFEPNRGPWVYSEDALPGTNEKSNALDFGDVDRDGDIDLLVGNRDEEQNRLYLNQGDTTFIDATGTRFVVSGGNTQDVRLVDIDGDLDLDALMFNRGQQDRVAINDGEGRFSEQTLGRLPSELTSMTLGGTPADIDNDGDFDLVIRREDGEQTRILLNLGTNSGVYEDRTEFRLEDIWFHTPIEHVVADMDGDGFEDIVVVNDGQQNQLWINDGEGDFTDETYEYLPVKIDDSTSLDLGDIDGDGDLDMVVSNFEGEEFLYLNDGTGHFFDVTEERLPQTLDKKAWDVKFADINGDGDLDIFVGNHTREDGRCCGGANNFIFTNDGAGFFVDKSEEVLGNTNSQYTFGQFFADFDNDGDLEYLVANQDTCSEFLLYRNLGDGFNNDAGILSNVSNVIPQYSGCMGGISEMIARDFDGDGFIDIFAGFNSRQNRLWLNNFPQEFGFRDVTGTHIPGISDATMHVAHGDFDGDNDIDLFLANWNQRPRLHLNQGDGTFADVTATNVPDMLRRARAADFADLDLDGDIDFFIANDEQYRNTTFLNTGNNFYELNDEQTPWDNDRSRDVVIADIDGDGDEDVIVVGNGQNRIYFNKLF